MSKDLRDTEEIRTLQEMLRVLEPESGPFENGVFGKNTQLENCLRKAATSGDRASSAAALVMRGDVILANGGDTPDTYRQALVDAYLRVALMYTDEPCRAARASAMQKAASCFDKLGMAARAEGMRAQARTL